MKQTCECSDRSSKKKKKGNTENDLKKKMQRIQKKQKRGKKKLKPPPKKKEEPSHHVDAIPRPQSGHHRATKLRIHTHNEKKKRGRSNNDATDDRD